MSSPDLRARVRALLCQPSAPLPLPRTARGEVAPLSPPAPTHRFLPLLPAHQRLALEGAAHFMTLANAQPGEAGLAAVLDEAERRVGEGAWVGYALRVFLAHHPEGRTLPVPALHERAPHLVLPSERAEPPRRGHPLAPGAEVWLDAFREDAGLGELLDTWSVLFPAEGAPDPTRPERRLEPERRGERFWYTHQQLLARYDTERLAFGMPRVVPLGDYVSPLGEGYDARLPGFAPRPPGVSLRDVPGYALTEHATRRDRLCAAASSGLLWPGPTPLFIEELETLASTLESNPGSVDGEAWREPLGLHGGLHRMGLLLLACLGPTHERTGLPGVLAEPATAARDPLFYRWHRHVDDILDAWQHTHLPPHDVSEGPPVLLRKWLTDGVYPAHQSPDLLLCLHRDIPGADAPDFDGQRWGEDTFGGEHWTGPPPAFPASTQSLFTRLGRLAVRLPDGREVLKPRLEHEPFHYFLRMENRLPEPQRVTVRLFLAADAYAEDRRQWMELDRFPHTLAPSARTVVHRPARLASVVREGWPLNLLLPRGRREGMLFRFMVMLTRPELDDAELGYPFNRPFPPGTRIADLVAQPNIATRNIWIHHGE